MGENLQKCTKMKATIIYVIILYLKSCTTVGGPEQKFTSFINEELVDPH